MVLLNFTICEPTDEETQTPEPENPLANLILNETSEIPLTDVANNGEHLRTKRQYGYYGYPYYRRKFYFSNF